MDLNLFFDEKKKKLQIFLIFSFYLKLLLTAHSQGVMTGYICIFDLAQTFTLPAIFASSES